MSAMARAERQLRLAWVVVVFAGVILAGARADLRRVAGEHEAECARLRGQLDGALDHIAATRPSEPVDDDTEPTGDAAA